MKLRPSVASVISEHVVFELESIDRVTSHADIGMRGIMPSSGSCRVSWVDATEKRSYEGGGSVDWVQLLGIIFVDPIG